MRWTLGLLLLLLLVPHGAAALNDAYPYNTDIEFVTGFGAETTTLVSGAMALEASQVEGSAGFVNATGLQIRGLTQVCWTEPGAFSCERGDLSIFVVGSGSVGLRLPGALTSSFRAKHALGFFQDFRDSTDLVDFGLGRSMVVSAVGGEMRYDVIPRIPGTEGLPPHEEQSGGIVALDEATRMEIRAGANVVHMAKGAHQPVLFEGDPHISPFDTQIAILPFKVGVHAELTPATPQDAEAGLDLDRISNIVGDLSGSGERVEGAEGLEQSFLQGMLNGAVFAIPGSDSEGSFFDNFSLARFDDLRLTGGGTITAEGSAPLVVQDGEVKGAKPLVGMGWFAVPWWSIALWVVGIGLLVARMARRSPKKSEKWDQYRWIGWVSTVVVFLLVLWLWDREVKAVLGFSALEGGATVAGGVMFLVEYLFLGLVLFAAAAPLRLIFRNGLMLAGQGSFMSLPGPVAMLIGFFVGATLLPSYIEFLLVRVLEQVG